MEFIKPLGSVADIDTDASFLAKFGLNNDEILKQVEKDDDESFLKLLFNEFDRVKLNLDPYNWEVITGWDDKVNRYKDPIYSFKVRDKEIKIETHTESLSHTQLPKVALPKYQAWGDILRWCLQENVPGEFPFTAGFIRLSVRVKILHVCLRVKADQSVPTDVFIT